MNKRSRKIFVNKNNKLPKVRYGIIGCGMMGQEHIKNILLLNNAEITTIFEPNAPMQAKIRTLLPNVICTDSIEIFFNRNDIDCLIIASPNFTHATYMHRIMTTKPLPLLVEKPLITKKDDIDLVTTMIKNYPKVVWVAMEYRYMPPVADFISRVEDVTGGIKLLTIREHRFPFLTKVDDWNRFNANTGGTLVEKCCHFFDLMRLILNSEPVRIVASAGQAVNHLDESYNGEISDIWDNGYVMVDFANGARAMLELCMFADGSSYQEDICAVGARGKIECLVPGPRRFWPKHLGAPPTAKLIITPRTPPAPQTIAVPIDPTLLAAGDHNGATFYQHQKFQRAALNRTQAEVTLNDGLIAVKMGMAAQESAITGQVISMQ